MRNLWFLFPLALFSCSQVVNFLKWKHHYLSENIAIFHSNDDLFTKYLFLNEKRCHLMTFSWRLESKRTRLRGKRNHKFPAFEDSCRFYIVNKKELQKYQNGRGWNWKNPQYFHDFVVLNHFLKTCIIYTNELQRRLNLSGVFSICSKTQKSEKSLSLTLWL